VVTGVVTRSLVMTLPSCRNGPPVVVGRRSMNCSPIGEPFPTTARVLAGICRSVLSSSAIRTPCGCSVIGPTRPISTPR
jgi:hypothetical protein